MELNAARPLKQPRTEKSIRVAPNKKVLKKESNPVTTYCENLSEEEKEAHFAKMNADGKMKEPNGVVIKQCLLVKTKLPTTFGWTKIMVKL